MANDYLSEWREGLEPMLYWEMLLDNPAVGVWKYTAKGAVLAPGDSGTHVHPTSIPLSLYPCQLPPAHRDGSCTLSA